jgi:hypothetical protein
MKLCVVKKRATTNSRLWALKINSLVNEIKKSKLMKMARKFTHIHFNTGLGRYSSQLSDPAVLG